MNTQFLVSVLILFFVIIIVEGIIILRKDTKKSPKKEISVKSYHKETPVQYISSDKIKELKAKEERERKLRAKKAIEEGKIKVIQPSETVKQTQKPIRAGEVQRNEKEQYNLRKEVERNAKVNEGKWWIE